MAADSSRPGPPRFASELVGWSTGALLGGLAAVRRGKAVHPTGVVYLAKLQVSGTEAAPLEAQLLARPAQHEAIVRFSRSVGLPRPLPDLLGMAIRVLNAYGKGNHQDLLLISSSDHPLLHSAFIPAADVQQRPYSSSLPYVAGADSFLIGALPDPRSPRPRGGDEFARLDLAAKTGRLKFQLAVARSGGRFRPVADLTVGARLTQEADAVRFNPWNTGGGMAPAGVLNAARDRAYKLSQGAWRRTAPGGAQLQDAAERDFGLGHSRR